MATTLRPPVRGCREGAHEALVGFMVNRAAARCPGRRCFPKGGPAAGLDRPRLPAGSSVLEGAATKVREASPATLGRADDYVRFAPDSEAKPQVSTPLTPDHLTEGRPSPFNPLVGASSPG